MEKKREEVANKINTIFKNTQDKVVKKLDDVEKHSMKRFDDGNAKATAEFENSVNSELEAFKAVRYKGIGGKVDAMMDKVAKWIADKAKKLFGAAKPQIN